MSATSRSQLDLGFQGDTLSRVERVPEERVVGNRLHDRADDAQENDHTNTEKRDVVCVEASFSARADSCEACRNDRYDAE